MNIFCQYNNINNTSVVTTTTNNNITKVYVVNAVTTYQTDLWSNIYAQAAA